MYGIRHHEGSYEEFYKGDEEGALAYFNENYDADCYSLVDMDAAEGSDVIAGWEA